MILSSTIAPNTHAQDPAWTLIIPENTYCVSTFNDFRTLKQEYQLQSKLYLKPGRYSLPTESGEYPISVFDRLEYSPNRIPGIPQSSGKLTVERATNNSVETVYYTIEHDIDIGDQIMHVEWKYLSAKLENGAPTEPEFILEEPYLSQRLYIVGKIQVGENQEWLQFAPERYEGIPAWLMNVELENDRFIHLYYRYKPPLAGSGPANLVYAEVNIDEGQTKQADYWKLVYAAFHHNWNEQFMALFDEPLGDIHGVVVYGWNIHENEPEHAYIIDRDFNAIGELNVVKVTRTQIETIPFPSTASAWERYE